MTGTARALCVIFAIIILAAPWGCSSEKPRATTGKPLPPVTLTDLEGKGVRLPGQYDGSLVVILFWEKGCPLCTREMPLAEGLYRKYMDRGLVLLALNMGDRREVVEEAVSGMGITYPVLLDPGRVTEKKFGIKGFPTIFFVGRDGVVSGKILGAVKISTLEGMVEERL
jgi:peroxiredoxin